MSDEYAFTLLNFLCRHYTCNTNVKSVFNNRLSVGFSTDRHYLSMVIELNLQTRVVLSLTYCAAWSHGNCPGAAWYTPRARNCDYTPNAVDGRSIKAGEGRTGERAESQWWYSIQFKCILLVPSISHIMLGQARGQFIFSKGFKKQIYCIADEYKVDSSTSEPSMEYSFGFSGQR